MVVVFLFQNIKLKVRWKGQVWLFDLVSCHVRTRVVLKNEKCLYFSSGEEYFDSRSCWGWMLSIQYRGLETWNGWGWALRAMIEFWTYRRDGWITIQDLVWKRGRDPHSAPACHRSRCRCEKGERYGRWHKKRAHATCWYGWLWRNDSVRVSKRINRVLGRHTTCSVTRHSIRRSEVGALAWA